MVGNLCEVKKKKKRLCQTMCFILCLSCLQEMWSNVHLGRFPSLGFESVFRIVVWTLQIKFLECFFLFLSSNASNK